MRAGVSLTVIPAEATRSCRNPLVIATVNDRLVGRSTWLNTGGCWIFYYARPGAGRCVKFRHDDEMNLAIRQMDYVCYL